MTQQLKFAFLALLVSGATWFAPAAKADEWDKKTVLTFNEPVEIPGRVLPAGTYVFKLADSDSDRNIVEIYTEDEKHLVTTVFAISDYRLEPTGKTVVTFEERPSGSPEALHNWFYPGDLEGFQFVYSKSNQQNADRSVQPVTPPAAPAAPVQQTAAKQDDAPPEIPVVLEEKEEVILAQATPPAPADNGVATNMETAPATLPESLPQTAGNFAMIPLLGIVLLSGGFTALRFGTRQN